MITIIDSICYEHYTRRQPAVGQFAVGAHPDGSGQAGHAPLRLGGERRLIHFSGAAVAGGNTSTVMLDGSFADRSTLWVAFWKSEGCPSSIFMNFCGLRSTYGNHELCTCTMMRWPRRKVWKMSGSWNSTLSGLPGSKGTGFSKLLRNFPRKGSPRTSCW